jgi:hypothetical protein
LTERGAGFFQFLGRKLYPIKIDLHLISYTGVGYPTINKCKVSVTDPIHMYNLCIKNFIYNKHQRFIMLENLNLIMYITLGFAVSYLALELGWHFTACRIKDKPLKPCIFKQVKCRLVANAG